MEKPCLIFLLAEDAPWPMTATDSHTGDGDRGRRIEALREARELQEAIWKGITKYEF